jgi:mannose-6-phosphate isomerase-like protein (cupin superfamily)
MDADFHSRAHDHSCGREQAEADRGVCRPEFQEITLVLRGTLRVEHDGGSVDVSAGQAIVTRPGEWVRYASPAAGGAEYVAVCLPAFSPDTVHRFAVP